MGKAVPEPLAVQEFWAETIVPDGAAVEFRKGRDITILRSGVPKAGTAAKTGVCCVYFVKDDRHFLAMVSEKELNKMEGTLGTGRDQQTATNHALTLRFGMEKAAKKMGRDFNTVEACFGFWFDVCKQNGVVYTFRSCANYFNHGLATRQLQESEETRLLAALNTVSAIPKMNADSTGSGTAAPNDRNIEVERAGPAKKKLKTKKDDICSARRPISGVRCTTKRSGESRWCLEHWDQWHGEESPVWDESGRVPEVEHTICPAWVNTTGLRCIHDLKEDSHWCGIHRNKWTGKKPPVWCPLEDLICLARVDKTGVRCTRNHEEGSLWCRMHKNRWADKDPPEW